MMIKASNLLMGGRFEIITADEDFYTYLALALLGLSLLRRESKLFDILRNGGLYDGFFETIRRIARGRLRFRDDVINEYSERLTLGTLFWGPKCKVPKELQKSAYWEESLGGMLDILKIWPSKIPHKTNR